MRIACCLLASILTLIPLSGFAKAAEPKALPTPEFLLALARDHGLNQRGEQTPADVQQVRVLLEAATRLDPSLVKANLWLHELALLRGDQAAMTATLRAILQAEPGHESAFARWLELGLAKQATIEACEKWLEQTLANAPQDPILRAMVHVQLARIALAQLEERSARDHVQQALQLDPYNVAAARLTIELLPQQATPVDQLTALLRYLQLRPYDAAAAAAVGRLLDRQGLMAEAEKFFAQARQAYTRYSGRKLPADFLVQLARHAVARGMLDEARTYALEAIQRGQARAAEAGILLHWVLQQAGRTQEAQRIAQQLAQRFEHVQDSAEWPANELAQAAWFYVAIDENADRALPLAEAAAERSPEDPFVLRVLGWARAAAGKALPAQAALTQVADQDAFAAYRLARLLLDAGDRDAARRVVRSLDAYPQAGPAAKLLASLELDVPAPDSNKAIETALRRFPAAVLQFDDTAASFVDATITPLDRTPMPGEPWWVEFTLSNKADFPITLDPDGMLNPVFLVSVRMEGDRERTYPDVLTVSLDEAQVLRPGQTIHKRVTLDVGPPRRAARLTPQQAQRVTLAALLDPVQRSDGSWSTGIAGRQLKPVYLNQLAIGVSRDALRSLLHTLADGKPLERFAAVEQLAQLLSEAQRNRLGRLAYSPAPVPRDRIAAALRAALTSTSWELRARTLDALQIIGFDEEMLAVVNRSLADEHWLVRLLAVRLLGERQGAAARQLLAPLAKDSDEFVRRLTQSYLQAWPTPTTQPAPTQPAP